MKEDIFEVLNSKNTYLNSFRIQHQNFYESIINKKVNTSEIRKKIKKIKKITIFLRKFQDHKLNKDDYSPKTYKIYNEQKGDYRFYKVFSSPHKHKCEIYSMLITLIIRQKVDIRNQSFGNIKESESGNLDINGVVLKGVQYFY
ncbi:unnamed protein product [Paramecium pentaurelia]|uniref:Uncharacterized protein n=1 Tax=Paramecium pentaurelia TaxID=43138 RepID=A0A8S1UYW0_9CILI|nr:unnamed protein product [Paramecium pentaurelia]